MDKKDGKNLNVITIIILVVAAVGVLLYFKSSRNNNSTSLGNQINDGISDLSTDLNK